MTKVDDAVVLTQDAEVAVITVDNPPVNALGRAVRDGLLCRLEEAHATKSVRAIVIVCAGKTFVAGADIRELGQKPEGATLPEVFQATERSDKPVIAAMHGTALGGGLELSLACDYRVASADALVGLPEVKLGILPGAGGTQRLPRVVGVDHALELMLSGEPWPARRAHELGLVDVLVQGELREGALAFARALVREGAPRRRVRDRQGERASEEEKLAIDKHRRAIAKKKHFPNYEKIVQCVEASLRLTFDEGLSFERALYVELRDSAEAKAQRHAFFAERQVGKIPEVPNDTKTRAIAKVGIVGAGTMGGGIAMNFLSQGMPVVLVEQKQDNLDRGVATIRKNYERSLSRGKLTASDLDARMALLSPSLRLEDLAECDLVIEAVFELMDIKREVLTKLDAIAKPGAILASNTSYLDLNDLAQVTSRPEDVIGMHFFSPANVMKLLEVVRGEKTKKDVIATVMKLGRKLGKIPVLVGVCRGFVGNRMLAARTRESQRLVLEGVMPWQVDRVLEDFGFPMGPFAMADLAGLDIGWDPRASRGEEKLRDRLCELGRKGQKTGAGYYKYDPETRERTLDPEIEALVHAYAHKAGFAAREVSDEEILERCLYPMVNEGAKILDEGTALRAGDIDVVWIHGYGFPVFRGGPMSWADSVGLGKIVERLGAYEARLGDDFSASPLLARFAREGRSFSG